MNDDNKLLGVKFKKKKKANAEGQEIKKEKKKS